MQTENETLEERVERLERLLEGRGGMGVQPRRLPPQPRAGVQPMLVETEVASWMPQHDYTPAEDRSVIRSVRPSPGVLSYSDFTVTAATPNSWNVVVSAGRAIVDGDVNPWTQGTYVVYSASSRTVPITPAHPTLDRYDVVIVHVVDQDNSTDTGYGWIREVITGTPGSGLPPSLPPNSLPLRGIKVAAGSTSITPSSFYPPIWPWQSGSDLRRPAGKPLMHILDTKRNVAIPNGSFVKPAYFDLQIPTGWTSLALWQFDVIMEVQISVQLFFAAAGTIQMIYDPTNNSQPGQTPGNRETNNILRSSAAGNEWISFQDMQLFTVAAGLSPQWSIQFQGSGITGTARVDATTRIWPRTVNINKVDINGIVF